MLDRTAAGPGHNNPPAYDPEILKGLSETTTNFMDASQVWLDMEAIATEEHASQLTDQIDGLRGLWKKVDEARKTAKKPHDAAGQTVQDAFNPLLKKLKAAGDSLKPKLATYAEQKAREEEAKRAEERRIAEEQTRAAEAAKKEAEASGNIAAQIDAEEQAKAAEEAAKRAEQPVKTQVKSATGAGRTMAMRKIKEVEIENPRVLFLHYQNHPDVIDTLRRLATADVRAKGYDPEAKPIPGIKVTERNVMA